MNQVEVHEAPKPAIVAHLHRLGHRIEPAPREARFDFLVDGQIRLALRVAHRSATQRRVRVGGRQYHYVYRAWNFNFHHRGRVGDRYSDVVACLPVVPGQIPDLAQAFVIPWEAISGKTFCLQDSHHLYAGGYARYRNAWGECRRCEGGEPLSREPTGEGGFHYHRPPRLPHGGVR